MKSVFKILFAASVLALASCADVRSKAPIGETAAKLEPKDWNGTWAVNNGHTVQVCVNPSKPGLVEIGWVESENDALKFKTLTLKVTEAGGWLWASFREKDNEPYTIARVSVGDDHFLAWTFLPAPFADRVVSGALKGEIVKDNEGKNTKSVLLDTLTDAQLTAIKDGKYGEVIDWANPP